MIPKSIDMIKKITFFLVVIIIVPFFSMAQSQKQKKEKTDVSKTKSEMIRKQINELIDSLQLLCLEQSNALQIVECDTNGYVKKIKDLQDSVFKLRGEHSQYVKDDIAYQDSIRKLNRKVRKMQDELKMKSDSMKIIQSFDQIIYKECLLYPLERRYDSTRLVEAKHCLDLMTSVKVKQPVEYKTYYHFLTEYAKYNREVLGFLEELNGYFEKKAWPTGSAVESYVSGQLKKLTYYQFYEKRNIKPWESILYLDEVLDDFLKVLRKGEINKDTMQEFIKRVKPVTKR